MSTARTAAERTRRRSVAALFAGVALTTTAWVAASTAATLIAGDAAGAAWSGAPNAAGVLGTALGTTWLAVRMGQRGRRYGLLLGYGVGVVGAGTALAAAQSGLLALLALGMVLLGIGNGAAQLSRYAAADLYPPHRRSSVLGLIVWSGTVGALVGPTLLPATADVAGAAGLTPLAGPFLFAAAVSVVSVLATTALAGGGAAGGDGPAEAAPPVREMLRLPVTMVALITMIAAQVSMVAVMTMTPLHLHQVGHGLGTIGSILSVHLLGMFALSPVTGRIADAVGGYRTGLAGLGTLLSGVLCAVAVTDGPVLFLALFLLGYGWNLAFVGASGMLSADLTPSGRTRLQGVVDSAAWTASGLATIVAGILLGSVGYGSLAAVTAAGLVVAAAAVVAAARRHPVGTRAPVPVASGQADRQE